MSLEGAQAASMVLVPSFENLGSRILILLLSGCYFILNLAASLSDQLLSSAFIEATNQTRMNIGQERLVGRTLKSNMLLTQHMAHIKCHP